MATARSASLKSQTVVSSGVRVTKTKDANLPVLATSVRQMSLAQTRSEQDFDSKYTEYFNRPDIDGWGIRKVMGELVGMDLVPEPSVVAAALRACRRVDDFSLTTRILEVVKIKCEAGGLDTWSYMVQELSPILQELGIPTPGEMGYDQPELALPNPYNIH